MKQPFFLLFFLLLSLHALTQLTYNELTVQYDSVWHFKNLALIPVKFKSSGQGNNGSIGEGNVISFGEAMQSGKLSVKEMITPQGSDINVLLIKNHTKKNVLVNSGEMVKGGKQDRVAATTSIIPPGDEFYLSVYCIEKGRWSDKIKSFNYAGAADIHLKKEIDVAQKQNDVWKEIDHRFKNDKRLSDTWPYLDLYYQFDEIDSAYYRYFISRFQSSDSAFAGFIAVTNDQIINCELFASTELCRLSYQGLITTYIRGLINKENTKAINTTQAVQFCNKFLKSNEQQQSYVPLHGRIDKLDGSVLHLVVYE